MISSMNGRVSMLLCLCTGLLASGCEKSADQIRQDRLEKLIPADLMSKVDETVSFTDLRSTPSTYVRRVVMLSGVALNARLVKGGTEIEILQLPTDTGWHRPIRGRDRKDAFWLFTRGVSRPRHH